MAGIISEPIQSEGGDNHASSSFFQGLADICKKYDISLMMDEVQTGAGASGKMWCHQHFGIEADVVSFSKKMLSGGIYHNLEHRPHHPGRILNTWVGDPHKIIMLEQVTGLDILDSFTTDSSGCQSSEGGILARPRQRDG